MKFQSAIEIEAPREYVVSYFNNPEMLHHWQDGFLRKETLQGPAQSNGAVSMLYYKQGRHGVMELTETILENNLPDYFAGHYHHKHMDNTLRSSFEVISEFKTRYSIEGEYLEFRGFIPKLLAKFFPGMFKKQAEKWMVNFKNFVEQELGKQR